MLKIGKRQTKLRVNESTADMLPWGILSGSGIVQTKDGAFVAGFYLRPPDSASSTMEQQETVSRIANDALSRLGDGWATWTDVCSVPTTEYPAAHRSFFPYEIARRIDEERRAAFMQEGAHFENERVLCIGYLPPPQAISRLSQMIYEDTRTENVSVIDRIYEGFRLEIEKLENLLSLSVGLRRMQSYAVTGLETGKQIFIQDELVNYLNYCATGRAGCLMLPDGEFYLDHLIQGQELEIGETPILGGDYLAVVAVDGFPVEHFPNMAAALNTLEIPYRYSQRMLHMDAATAIREIHKYRKQWGQMVEGIKNSIVQISRQKTDRHAAEMESDAEDALRLARSGEAGFGWYSATITLRNTDEDVLRDWARYATRVIHACGFGARTETINAIEAWRGGLPGEFRANVRRPVVSTQSLASFLPLSGIWTGHEYCPCPMYPQQSPPLLYAKTTGSIPFRLNLHVHDTGHTLVLGPVGTGKSFLLNTVALQAFRYEGMKVWARDYKRGMFTTVKACGGRHYELGGDNSPQFCPLYVLDDENDLSWAQTYIEFCCELQLGPNQIGPDERGQIRHALLRLQGSQHRSLTNFCVEVQSDIVRRAMEFYTNEGPAGFLLDAVKDGIDDSNFVVFEQIDLFPLGEKTFLPVLQYLDRAFERSLTGNPSLAIMDEAGVQLGHKLVCNKQRAYLRLLRSKNCAVVMATQNASDITESELVHIIRENVPLHIYLANPRAHSPVARDVYYQLGLNEQQVTNIANMIPKRDLYVTSPEGSRIIETDPGPSLRRIAGATSEQDYHAVSALIKRYGEELNAEGLPRWLPFWLNEEMPLAEAAD